MYTNDTVSSGKKDGDWELTLLNLKDNPEDTPHRIS
jgi:hypothetical protein